jgi:cell division protein FtsL
MRRFLKGAAVYLALIFVFSLGYVWTRVQVVETGYRLRALEVQRDKLKEENRSLMVEAATLKSPQRLEQIAKQSGLRRPAESQIVFLKKEKP